MEFDEALQLAQDLGYAEADPTSDIEGLDAGRKVAILASAAFNSRVVFENVYTEGLRESQPGTSSTRKRWDARSSCWELPACAGGHRGAVHPMLIDSDHPLASVQDSYNAVFVRGDAVQDTMFYGRGAGEMPTASAVVGDVFDCVRNILADCCGRIGCTCYKDLPVRKISDIRSKYFVRMEVEDRSGVLASVAAVFWKQRRLDCSGHAETETE